MRDACVRQRRSVLELMLARVGAAALILCSAGMVLPDRVRFWLLRVVLPVGTVTLGAALALRWRAAGQGPFLTLYEVVLSNVFSLGFICALAFSRWQALRAGAPVAVGLIGLLALWTLFLPDAVTPLPPNFDNPWLWAHVLSGKVFLGLLLLATGIAARLLLGRLPGDEQRALDGEIWRFAALAFVFDTLMLVTGAVWAHDAWGRYWAWDPLESSAFLTWLALALLLHLRLAWRLALRAQWVMLCAVFALAFLTFFGMPFLSLAPHKGIL